MTAQVWAEIRRLHIIEGLSARHIGRMMRLDKKTVRRAIMQERFQDKRGNSHGGELKLTPYVKDIAELLEKYPTISGQRIYEEIIKRGYNGKITILRDYLRKARIYTRPAYLRIETLPAEQAQVDWADCGSIKVGEYCRKLSCFVMVLSYSRLMYLEFTLSQRLETFMECHVNAFKFFGGIPQKILYDNLRSVVLVRFGREIRFNPRFDIFRGHYMFEAVPCNPGCANEKGKVENGIKYVKRNFIVGRAFKSFSDLKTQSVEWRDRIANNRIHGTTRKQPSELYLLEKDKLRKLADNDYDTSIVIPTKSSKDCRVTFDTNTYSVPFKYASCAVTIRATSEQIKIYTGNTLLIANHRRSYEKYQVIEDSRHYQELIAMKKKAGKYKKRDMFLSIADNCKEYLRGMVNAELNLTHHIEKILELVDSYGKTTVRAAIIKALTYQAYGYAYIKNIILQQRAKEQNKNIITPLSIMGNKEFAQASVEERDLDIYDNLFSEEENQ